MEKIDELQSQVDTLDSIKKIALIGGKCLSFYDAKMNEFVCQLVTERGKVYAASSPSPMDAEAMVYKQVWDTMFLEDA